MITSHVIHHPQEEQEGDSIRLRAMEPEDLDLLYSIENDVSLWDVGTTNVPYSRYTLHDYIANASGDIYTDRQVRLIIETDDQLTGDHQAVGIADIVNFDAKHRRAEVGIVIRRNQRHQGYAQNTIARLADYALSVLHLHQLYAVIAADNQFCIRLFEKMGYTATSQLRQWLFDGREYHDAVVMQIIL